MRAVIDVCVSPSTVTQPFAHLSLTYEASTVDGRVWKVCLDRASRTDEHRDLGVVDDVVTDAAKERTSNGVQTASAHHDQLSLLGVGDADDALTGVLA